MMGERTASEGGLGAGEGGSQQGAQPMQILPEQRANQRATAEKWAAFSHRDKKSSRGKIDAEEDRTEVRKRCNKRAWRFRCHYPCDSIWPPRELLWLL